MPVPKFLFAANVIDGPYDGVINMAMAGLLLPCDIPTSPNALWKIQQVRKAGLALLRPVFNADKSINMEVANPLLAARTEKLESAREAVVLAKANRFTADEVYSEGFDHVARYLVEVFEDQGMPGVELPAQRILEATDEVFVAANAVQMRFDIDSFRQEARFNVGE